MKKIIQELAYHAENLSVPKEIEGSVLLQEKIHPQPAPYYRFFYHLAKTLKPSYSIELGTNHGVAAACLAMGNRGGDIAWRGKAR